MKFKTNYDSTLDMGEKLSDESMTEQTGYATVGDRVKRMLMAGESLEQANKRAYSIQEGENPDDALVHPENIRNYDMVDAQADIEHVKAVYEETIQKLEKERQLKADALKETAPPPEGDLPISDEAQKAPKESKKS